MIKRDKMFFMTTWCDEHLIKHQGQQVEAVGEYKYPYGKRVNLCQMCAVNYSHDIELVTGRSIVEISRREERAQVIAAIYN